MNTSGKGCTSVGALSFTRPPVPAPLPAAGDAFEIRWRRGHARPLLDELGVVAVRLWVDTLDAHLQRQRDAVAQDDGLLLGEAGELVEQFAVDAADDALEVLLVVRVLDAVDDEAVALREHRPGELAGTLGGDDEAQAKLAALFGDFLEDFASALLPFAGDVSGDVVVRLL